MIVDSIFNIPPELLVFMLVFFLLGFNLWSKVIKIICFYNIYNKLLC
jgi:hypothetical protein